MNIARDRLRINRYRPAGDNERNCGLCQWVAVHVAGKNLQHRCTRVNAVVGEFKTCDLVR